LTQTEDLQEDMDQSEEKEETREEKIENGTQGTYCHFSYLLTTNEWRLFESSMYVPTSMAKINLPCGVNVK
jgi:hypothetical protein